MAVALGIGVARGVPIEAPGYVISTVARAHESVIVAAPLCAAAAAWKSGRLRRAGWTARLWGRGAASIGLRQAVRSAAVAMAGYLIVLGAITVPSDVGLSADGRLLGVAAALFLAYAAVGFTAGWLMRVELALPLVVVGGYLWMVYPMAMEPLWLRHLNGSFGSCCTDWSDLAPGAVRGAAGVSIAAGCAALIALAALRRRPLMLAVPVLLTGGVFVGVRSVDDLGADPVVARTTAVVCSDTRPRVCVWPEHEAVLGRLGASAEHARSQWDAARLPSPAAFTEAGGQSGWVAADRSVIGAKPDATDGQLLAGLSHGLVPPIPESCPDDRPLRSWSSPALIWALYATTAGLDYESVLAQIDAGLAGELERLAALDDELRDAWLTLAVAATSTCGHEDPPVPR